MLRLRTPAHLLVGGALALALTACGSEPTDADSGSTGSTGSSTSAPSTPAGSEPAPSNSGIVPDNAWAAVVKKAAPPLAEKSDEEVVAAARKICTDFGASPTKETADAILQDAETTLGLDTVQQQVFASAAVTHYCTDQVGAWTQATLG